MDKDQFTDCPKDEDVQHEDIKETALPRREALEKMGKFAAYTAPAMLVLLISKKAKAATG